MKSSPAETLNTLSSALHTVTQVVPPLFPLRHFVAVNPYLGYAGVPITSAAADLATRHDATVWMPGRYYAERYHSGALSRAELEAAQLRLGTVFSSDELHAWTRAVPESKAIPTFSAFLDARQPGTAWEHWVACQIGQFCGAYFDVNQSTWSMPWKHLPLLEAWREYARYDASPEMAGVHGFHEVVAGMPEKAAEVIEQFVAELCPQGIPVEAFLVRQATSLPGWAGYVQFRVREHALRGRSDDSLIQFLAIRMAYDVALLKALGSKDMMAAWQELKVPEPESPNASEIAQVWQTAAEIAFQRGLLARISIAEPKASSVAPTVQAVFCIDVRSERLRRHLEQVEPTVQTVGFAGFFGMPVQFSDPLTGETTSRVPALFAPRLNTALAESEVQRLQSQRELTRAWHGFQHAAASCFTYVESFGLGAVAMAFKPKATPLCTSSTPAWRGVSFEERLGLAEGALRGMGLTTRFAPVVLICGHGSANVNNPQASALECGACGGHSGDHNARLAAGLFNDAKIRAGLASRGIKIPDTTVFVAGLHNTTTDEVELLDIATLAPEARERVMVFRAALVEAASRARAERDAQLGHTGFWSRRMTEVSETRPEFGLANNAAILLAPRSMTRTANLEARVFLHDYTHEEDASSEKLIFLLSAPVVVASWINLQYYASRVAPDKLGSGNKVLHNVCGAIGVVEGNGGDIRPGLSWQSLHDGAKFVHEPLRLSVVVAAPREKIDGALAKAGTALDLIENHWIHLIAIEGSKRYTRRSGGSWLEIP